MNRIRSLVFVLIMLLVLVVPFQSAKAATITVCASGCDYTTIQAAVNNATATDNDIYVQAGTYTEQDIDIVSLGFALTIRGDGAGTTIVQAYASPSTSSGQRVFDISNSTVTFEDLTIRNGRTGSDGNDGGGIRRTGSGNLTLDGVALTNNSSTDQGAGLYFSGTSINNLSILNSVISSNTSVDEGGGIYLTSGSTDIPVTITNSTINGNSTGTSDNDHGGGIYADDVNMTISYSTISGNSANEDGGGIFLINSTLTMTNSTLSGNDAGDDGGGINSDNSTASFYHVTIYDNTAGDNGGGIRRNNGGNIYYQNTIIAGNAAGGSGDDCNGSQAGSSSLGYNLVGLAAGCVFDGTGDQATVNPLLGALANNGGPTQTHALQSGSPALDQIPNATSGCGTTYTDDQRSSERPSPTGGSCDVGAFELLVSTFQVGLTKQISSDNVNFYDGTLPFAVVPGSTLYYKYTVTNNSTDSEVIQETRVDDDVLGNDICTVTNTINPTQSNACTETHVAVGGGQTNTATGEGLISGGSWGTPADVATSSPDSCTYNTNNNPPLEGQCGMDFILVLDESYSICSSGTVGDVRNGTLLFLNAIADTGSRVALVEFHDPARDVVLPGYNLYDYIPVTSGPTGTIATLFTPYINDSGGANPNYDPCEVVGYTNWDDALEHADDILENNPVSPPPMLIFFTDGNPNRDNGGCGGPVPCAVAEADHIKEVEGVHMFVMGVTGATESNLIAISGPDEWDNDPPGNPLPPFEEADYALTTFAGLADAFTQLVTELCQYSFTATKYVWDFDLTDWVVAPSWNFTGTVQITAGSDCLDSEPGPFEAGDYDWEQPIVQLGPQTVADRTQTLLTDGSGTGTWQWEHNATCTSQISVNETIQDGYYFQLAKCSRRSADGTITPIPDITSLPVVLDYPANDSITCDFVNTNFPDLVTVDYFIATPKFPGLIELEWMTSFEDEFTLGFYVYRGTEPGECSEQISSLIGLHGPGIEYYFDDTNAEAGQTYYYCLVSEDVGGGQQPAYGLQAEATGLYGVFLPISID